MSLIDDLKMPQGAVDDAANKAAEQLTSVLPRAIRSVLGPGDPRHGQNPTEAALSVMAALSGRRAALLDHGTFILDPDAAPDETLPWLAAWFGWGWMFRDPADPAQQLSLAHGFPPGREHLINLIRAWPALNRLRGRADGLRLTLTTATGLPDITVSAQPERQHIAVHARDLPQQWTPWFRRLIAAERPAHLTWNLDKGDLRQ